MNILICVLSDPEDSSYNKNKRSDSVIDRSDSVIDRRSSRIFGRQNAIIKVLNSAVQTGDEKSA